MQIVQLNTRDLTVIMEGHQQYGARCWELCSLSSKRATSITPPDGCVSILAFSTYGNAGIKHGVTTVPRFPEWPATIAGEMYSRVTKEQCCTVVVHGPPLQV